MPKTAPFDQYADQYDKWFENNQAIFQTELEAIRQLIPSNNLEGIEVGVGSGKFAAPLGIKVGIEPSMEMAVKAEKLGIEVWKSVAEKLPFADARFDFVLMVTVLCFVDDMTKTLQEAYRVIKPGGFILIGFIDKESKLGEAYDKKRKTSLFYKEASFWSAEEVQEFLIKTGFTDLKFKQTLIPEEAQNIIQDGFGKGAFVVVKGGKSVLARSLNAL